MSLTPFDPTAADVRLKRLWDLKARFGMERSAFYTYLNEIVSDRYTLVNGLQLLRDELQFAATVADSDIVACGADMSVPSVVTTLATTNCGDRIHQGEATISYQQTVAARFATMSEIGELKVEAFSPTGGGTDDGGTLAHVTVAHQLDEPLRKAIYNGNAQSFVLCGFDLKTHVGRLDVPGQPTLWGKTAESPWRQPRAACGAVVGVLAHFNAENAVHRRLRSDLGEANFQWLTKNKLVTSEGADCNAVAASSIVAVQGMINTARALTRELDERGVAHLTASVTVNRVAMNDSVIYLARATVARGKILFQGIGTDVTKFSGRMVKHADTTRLVLGYDGHEVEGFPVIELSAAGLEPSSASHDDI